MAGFFTKLDAGITDSTIWHQPDHTRLTWITMLAMADQHGYVGASIPGLASRARVPLDACVAALECFKAPDEYSRTKDHDGRRIADADGGWILLNHAKYRAAQSADDRRERSRIAMAALRARRKAEKATDVNGEQTLTMLAQAEADNRSRNKELKESTHRVVGRGARLPPDWNPGEAGFAFASKEGLLNGRTEVEVEKFRDYWTAATGQHASKADWQAAWRTWVRKAVEIGGKPFARGEPEWKKEQRDRTEAFAGPAAAKRQQPETFDVVAKRLD